MPGRTRKGNRPGVRFAPHVVAIRVDPQTHPLRNA